MSIGTDIIKKAFAEIGAHSVVTPAPAEAIVEGMDKLNSMIQEWESRDVKIGAVALRVPGDELGEPLDTTEAIVYNLAIRSAPMFNATVSPELRGLASNTFSIIKGIYRLIEVPRLVPTSTLPRGSGHSRGVWNRQFMPKGENFDA